MKIKKIKFFLLGVTLLSIMESAKAGLLEKDFFEDHPLSQGNTNPSNDQNSVRPGTGYYSYTQMPLSRNCLNNADDPDVISFGALVGVVRLDKTVSLDEMENVFGVEIKGRGGYSLFRTSASAMYMKSIENTRYSQAFNYYQSSFSEVSYKSPEYRGKKALSHFAQDTLSSGTQKFANACGDSYVNKAHGGAVLSINVNVDFSSTTEKENFLQSTTIGVIGLGKVTQAVQNAYYKYRMKGSLSVKAYQLGGDPSRLANIFQKGSDGYYLLNCDFDHLDQCDKGINGVLDYARDDFAHQIQLENGKPVNPNSIYYIPIADDVEKYTNLGIQLPLSPPSDEIVGKQIELMAWYNVDRDNLIFLTHFLNSQMRSFLPQESLQTLSFFEKNIESRLREYPLASVSGECWGPDLANSCSTAYDEIVKSREYYQVDNLQIDHMKNDAFQVGWRQGSQSGQPHVIYFVPLAYPQQLYKAFGDANTIRFPSSLSYGNQSLSYTFHDDGNNDRDNPYFHNATLPFIESEYSYKGTSSVYNKYGNFVANDPTIVMKKDNPL